MNRIVPAALALAAALLATGCPSPAKDPCVVPSEKCGDRCVNTLSDPSNCGACGRACGAGTSCCAGDCLDPVALQTDASNCGTCGNRCAVNGTCTAGTCGCGDPAYPDDCGGACVNLQTGASGYCGSCGWTCAATGVSGADAPCTAGVCVCAGTPQATDCGNGGSGQCVNTTIDERNCGGCGAVSASFVCKPRALCTGGACGCSDPAFPDECTSGCVNLQTDPAHCGGCATACSGATPTCSSGRCCPTGQVNCSGACVDTRTSAANCGRCGLACSSGQVCQASTCRCTGTTPLECDARCCAGTVCCGTGGTACQPALSNGLGNTFYSGCAASPTLSRSLALAAADAWTAGTATYDLFCNGNCLARQTNSACAMWCYDGTFAGHVTSGGINCNVLCTNLVGGGTPTWP